MNKKMSNDSKIILGFAAFLKFVSSVNDIFRWPVANTRDISCLINRPRVRSSGLKYNPSSCSSKEMGLVSVRNRKSGQSWEHDCVSFCNLWSPMRSILIVFA